MERELTQLPSSRVRLKVGFSVTEVEAFYELALVKLTSSVKIPGFRLGKAPRGLTEGKVDPTALREEAYSRAVADAWRRAVRELTLAPIEDPETEIIEFAKGRPGMITVEFDVRPEVNIGAWREIKLTAPLPTKVGHKDVEQILKQSLRQHASTTAKLTASALGDQVVIDFTGSIAGHPVAKLSGAKFPLVLGQTAVIPGFSEQLVGLKRGERKNFPIEFPPNHFDPELAAKYADFAVTVNEVYQINLPAVDDKLADKFGFKSVKLWQNSISDFLRRERKTEAKYARQADFLKQLAAKIVVELPESLIKGEILRMEERWRQFLATRQLVVEQWLSARQATLEQMQEGWRAQAVESLKVGLGLGNIAQELGRELKSDDDFQKLVEELTSLALKKR